MHLYWCTPENCPPYMHDYCRSLSDALDNLSYHTLAADAASSAVSAKRIAVDHPRIAGYDVYVAGPDDFVSSASRVFLDRGLAQERLFEYRNGSL
jgi:CDP-4-dehydro-6-deoxyglucose reductase